MKTLTLLIAFALLAFLPARAFATPSVDEALAIDHLITFVKDSKLEFIRNGTAYDSEAAAKHLQDKYAASENRLKTADEFIDNVASKSSISGQPYLIRSPDGTEKPVADWLHAELTAYREGLKKK
jgi:hypothetical protein